MNGSLFIAEFSICGHDLVGMNVPGGEKFNTAISLSIQVDGQAEVDRIWNAITAKGQEGRCGWCTDEFGLAWQVVPYQLGLHLGNPDPIKAQYANQAMLKMNKIIIDDLHLEA